MVDSLWVARQAVDFLGGAPGERAPRPARRFRFRLTAPLHRRGGHRRNRFAGGTPVRGPVSRAPHFCIPYHCDLAPFLDAPRPMRDPAEIVFLFCGQMIRRKAGRSHRGVFVLAGAIHGSVYCWPGARRISQRCSPVAGGRCANASLRRLSAAGGIAAAFCARRCFRPPEPLRWLGRGGEPGHRRGAARSSAPMPWVQATTSSNPV